MSWKNSVLRVLQGGSFSDDSRILRAARRSRGEPALRFRDVGFRIVIRRVKT
jgi:formylglycine-generating enzyme required for sulfatase activity